MIVENSIIKQAAKGSGIKEEDLKIFFSEGEKRTYKPNDWLIQEATPRQWAGIILEGDVELVRGLHGSSRHVATMIEGAIISEGAFLEGDAHSNGAFTRNGTSVWQISKEKIDAYRESHPEIFYRIVSRIAVGIRCFGCKLLDVMHDPGNLERGLADQYIFDHRFDGGNHVFWRFASDR